VRGPPSERSTQRRRDRERATYDECEGREDVRSDLGAFGEGDAEDTRHLWQRGAHVGRTRREAGKEGPHLPTMERGGGCECAACVAGWHGVVWCVFGGCGHGPWVAARACSSLLRKLRASMTRSSPSMRTCRMGRGKMGRGGMRRDEMGACAFVWPSMLTAVSSSHWAVGRKYDPKKARRAWPMWWRKHASVHDVSSSPPSTSTCHHTRDTRQALLDVVRMEQQRVCTHAATTYTDTVWARKGRGGKMALCCSKPRRKPRRKPRGRSRGTTP
jgi:hypothetical protein